MRRSESHHQQASSSHQQQQPQQQQAAPPVVVKRRKKCSKAIRFLRSIFTAPSSASSSSISAGNGASGSSSRCQPAEILRCSSAVREAITSAEASTETVGRCQHQRCRFHRQGSSTAKSASWLIEVSVPCICTTSGGGGPAAQATTPSPTPTPQTSPMTPPTPQPLPELLPLPPLPRLAMLQSSRQTLLRLQAANRPRLTVPHQSSPASGGSALVVPSVVHRPPQVAANASLGSDNNGLKRRMEQQISLREISSPADAPAAAATSGPTIERRHAVLHVVQASIRASSRQLALVPKTLWLRHETADLLMPPTPVILSTCSAASLAGAAASCASASRSGCACNHRPPDRTPTTSTTILASSQQPLPRRPPPQLSKLRAAPVVVRAPRSPLTPSPVRGVETVTVTASTQSSGGAPPTPSELVPATATKSPASLPFLGRVAGAVRHFDAIRGGGGGLGFVARPSCAEAPRPSFARNFGIGAISVAAAAPTVSAVVRATSTTAASPDNKPRPCFRELLAKFEAFDDRRRRQCAAAAAAAAASTSTTTMTTPTPTEAREPNRDDVHDDPVDTANVDSANDTPAPSLSGSTSGEDDDDDKVSDYSGDARVLAAQVAVGGGRSMAVRTLRIVVSFLVAIFLGQAVLRLVLAFGGELSDMSSRFH